VVHERGSPQVRLVEKGTLMRDRDDDSHDIEVVEIPAASSHSPEGAIHFLIGQLIVQGRVRHEDAQRVEYQILRREALGSTAIGRGLALPHSKSDVVQRPAWIVGRCREGMRWPGALDDAVVRRVCLLVTPASRPGESLRALGAAAKDLRRDNSSEE
jgi:PTS system fructose-specific IIA component/PTS system nitrogen regulatory IIA component